jgi:ankyrin repeat protein
MRKITSGTAVLLAGLLGQPDARGEAQFSTIGEISAEAQQLIDAGNAAGLRDLLRRKPELAKATNHVRWTLLHFVVRDVTRNQVDVCLALIEGGADVNAAEGEFNTPLHYAVGRPADEQPRASTEVYLQIIRLLLDKGANVNAKNIAGLTPLHTAVLRRGEPAAVELLIARGAAVNAVADQQGWIPLHGAAGSGRLDLVDILLAHGADRTAKDGRGLTPAQVAKGAGHAAIVKRLESATSLP